MTTHQFYFCSSTSHSLSTLSTSPHPPSLFSGADPLNSLLLIISKADHVFSVDRFEVSLCGWCLLFPKGINERCWPPFRSSFRVLMFLWENILKSISFNALFCVQTRKMVLWQKLKVGVGRIISEFLSLFKKMNMKCYLKLDAHRDCGVKFQSHDDN